MRTGQLHIRLSPTSSLRRSTTQQTRSCCQQNWGRTELLICTHLLLQSEPEVKTVWCECKDWRLPETRHSLCAQGSVCFSFFFFTARYQFNFTTFTLWLKLFNYCINRTVHLTNFFTSSLKNWQNSTQTPIQLAHEVLQWQRATIINISNQHSQSSRKRSSKRTGNPR